MRVEKYPPDWNQRRLTVLNRDRWTCQECGQRHTASSDTELHVHHIKPISEGGGHGLDNLETLCEHCHRAVHSDGLVPPDPLVDTYECGYCGHEQREDQLFKEAYCSAICWSRHKAETLVNGIEGDARICSTCFAPFPDSAETCPNCDNWDPLENQRPSFDDTDLDVVNLVATVIRFREGIH